MIVSLNVYEFKAFVRFQPKIPCVGHIEKLICSRSVHIHILFYTYLYYMCFFFVVILRDGTKTIMDITVEHAARNGR